MASDREIHNIRPRCEMPNAEVSEVLCLGSAYYSSFGVQLAQQINVGTSGRLSRS